jgi:protein XagA
MGFFHCQDTATISRAGPGSIFTPVNMPRGLYMKKNMPHRVLFIIAVNMVLCAAVNSCIAGAWTPESGESYHQLALNYYYAHSNFDDDGDRRGFAANGDFRDINTNYYMEYGLSDRLTGIASLFYKYLRFEDNTIDSKTYGISDMDLGVRYKLSDTPLGVFSIQEMVKIPEAYDEDDEVPLGNGQYDLETRLLYGKSFWPKISGYANMEIGYRWRFESPADEFRYLVELGMGFSQNIYGRVKLDGILSMENGDARAAAGNNPSVANAFDLGKLDLTLGYNVSSRCAVELGVRPDIYGNNTSAGTSASVAVAFKH